MCQSPTRLRCLRVLYCLILPTALSDKHSHDPYLKTEENKHTKVRKKPPEIIQAEFKLKA